MSTMVGSNIRVDTLVMPETGLRSPQHLEIDPTEPNLFMLLLDVSPQKVISRQVRAAFGRKHYPVGRGPAPDISVTVPKMVAVRLRRSRLHRLRFGNFALPEQVDVIVTQFAWHRFKGPDFSDTDMNRFLGAIYRGMNDSGVVIAVDNLAAEGISLDQAVAVNRMDPTVVKKRR
jgi:hypothetical protein